MLAFNFVPTSSFVSAVAFVAAHAKGTIAPIHKYLLLKVQDNGVVSVQATNGSYYLGRSCRVDAVREGGSVCLDAGKFSAILAKLPSDAQSVSVDIVEDAGRITGEVKAGRSRFKLVGESPVQFPQPELCSNHFKFTVPAAQMVAALDKANCVAPSNDCRAILNSVLMEVSATGDCAVVASDGMRLAKKEFRIGSFSLPADHPTDSLKMVMPKQQVGQLISLIGRNNAKELVFVVDRNRVAVIDPSQGWRLQFSLVDGQYPNWRSVVPRPSEGWTSIELEREALIGCLERARILADEKKCTIALSLNGSELSITSSNGDREEGAIEQMTCASSSGKKALRVCFNANFLLQAVTGLVGAVARLTLDGDNTQSAGLLEADSDALALQVVSQYRA